VEILPSKIKIHLFERKTMNCEDAMLEQTLRGQLPARLDHKVFSRMLAALESASMPVDAVDHELEGWLATQTPARLPDSLMVRLAEVPAPKVVPIPIARRVIPFRRYAAVAAVAMFGAAAALLAPIGDKGSRATADAEPATPVLPLTQVREFVPAGYARGLSEARDEGVIWRDNAPHRILRIVYTDTLTLTNEDGEIVEVEQPRVEYIVVPEKID